MFEWALFLISMTTIWYLTSRLPDKYPPTPPIRLPILGHAHYLLLHGPTKSSVIYELFQRYSRDGILTLHVGTWRFTVIGTHKLVKDLFSREDTNQRNPYFAKMGKMIRQSLTGTEGVVFNNGKNWHEQQRFMLSTLKNFGMGKTNVEGLINNEVAHFCNYMEKVLIPQMGSRNEKERQLNIFHIPIINILWDIVTGERYNYEDSKLDYLIKKIAEMMRVPLFQPTASTFLPILGKLFPSIDQPPSYAVIMEVKTYLSGIVKQHIDTFDSNNIRDFIDTYLLEIQDKGIEGSSFHPSQGYEQLVNCLIDLFVAGMETTGNTLSFAILFMVNNQEVQHKAREEIFDVIGRDRAPTLADKAKMPYCEATVMECQRFADVAPDGIPHWTKCSQRAGPYIIPEGHILMSSLTAVMKGENEWNEPDNFDPTRFIEDGKVRKSEAFIPFSAGKRQCPGESLAKAELFLFFVGLIQKFHFEAMQPGQKLEIVVDNGLTRMPLPTKPIKVTKII